MNASAPGSKLAGGYRALASVGWFLIFIKWALIFSGKVKNVSHIIRCAKAQS